MMSAWDKRGDREEEDVMVADPFAEDDEIEEGEEDGTDEDKEEDE